MDRQLWSRTLTETAAPAYQCPECGTGILALIPKSLMFKETVSSRRFRKEPEWDLNFVEYAFTAWLKCNQPSCGQEVAVIGKGEIDEHPIYDESGEIVNVTRTDRFKPLFCFPMPDILLIPGTTPTKISNELRAAFNLFWSDQSASAGRVRICLERLMDHFKIPTKQKGNDKKFHLLNLHNRITKFSEKNPESGDRLMAIKWLGNTALHQGETSKKDLLDGFEILENVLAEIFDHRSLRVSQLTRQLTKKHALRRKR